MSDWPELPRGEYDPDRGHIRAEFDDDDDRRPARPGRLTVMVALLGVLAVVSVFLYHAVLKESGTRSAEPAAQKAETGAPPPPAPAAPETQASAPPVEVPDSDHISAQAQQIGITTCLGRIVTLSKFLTTNTDYRYMATGGTRDADKQMFAAMIAAKEQRTGLRGVSTLSAAPVGDGECDASYSSTIYFPQPCEQARETVFPNFTSKIPLDVDFAEAFSTETSGGMLILIPAGESGCVAVKSEVLR